MIQITTLAILITFAGPATGWAANAVTPSAAETNPSDVPPAKIVRYAGRLLTRYDADDSGTLSPTEWEPMQGRPAAMDRDQNGQVTQAEMILHVHEYARYRRLGQAGLIGPVSPSPGQDQASDALITPADKNTSTEPATATPEKPGAEHPDASYYVPAHLRPSNLPSWFTQRDRNGDGQLSQAEFAPTRSREAIKSFERLDTNRDSLLTPQEATGPTKPKQPASESAGGAK